METSLFIGPGNNRFECGKVGNENGRDEILYENRLSQKAEKSHLVDGIKDVEMYLSLHLLYLVWKR